MIQSVFKADNEDCDDCTYAQADFNLHRMHMSKCTFFSRCSSLALDIYFDLVDNSSTDFSVNQNIATTTTTTNDDNNATEQLYRSLPQSCYESRLLW